MENAAVQSSTLLAVLGRDKHGSMRTSPSAVRWNQWTRHGGFNITAADADFYTTKTGSVTVTKLSFPKHAEESLKYITWELLPHAINKAVWEWHSASELWHFWSKSSALSVRSYHFPATNHCFHKWIPAFSYLLWNEDIIGMTQAS